MAVLHLPISRGLSASRMPQSHQGHHCGGSATPRHGDKRQPQARPAVGPGASWGQGGQERGDPAPGGIQAPLSHPILSGRVDGGQGEAEQLRPGVGSGHCTHPSRAKKSPSEQRLCTGKYRGKCFTPFILSHLGWGDTPSPPELYILLLKAPALPFQTHYMPAAGALIFKLFLSQYPKIPSGFKN